MDHDIIIKRTWVKKASIIFLITMLLLTFFSKTIMNASMPEVSVQEVKAGQMNLTVSGSGTAKAASTYEVMLNQTRIISEVLVQQGDHVEVGDVLFTLEEADSEELQTAMDALDDLNLQYQKMLLGQDVSDDTLENRTIARLKEDLQKAMQKREENQVSHSMLADAKNAYLTSFNQVSELENNASALQNELSEYSGASDETLLSMKRQIEDKKRQINAGSDDLPNPVSLASLQRDLNRLKEDYDLALAKYPDYDQISRQLTSKKSELQAAKQALSNAQSSQAGQADVDQLKEKVSALENAVNTFKTQLSDASELTSLLRQIEDKEREIANYSSHIDGPSVNVGQLRIELDRLEDDYETLKEKNTKFNRIKRQLADVQSTLKSQKTAMEAANNTYEELQKKSELRQAANEETLNLQRQLEDALFELESRQKQTQKQTALTNMDLSGLRKDIQRQNQEIQQLRADAENNQITAKKAGTVQTVTASAGSITAPQSALAVIETTEKGYELTISCSKEQSKRLTIGNEAKTDDTKVTATLSRINADPNGNKNERILTFSLDGEVVSGEEYSVTLNIQGTSYDLVIPQSALRSDSNGYFVLTVAYKATPFGARTVAQRINVEVLEQDDQTAGVKGSLRQGDYVITFSPNPLEPGAQIRMAGGAR